MARACWWSWSQIVIRSLREDVQILHMETFVQMVARPWRERMVAHDFADTSFLVPIWTRRRTFFEENSSVMLLMLRLSAAPIDEIQVEPCLMMATVCLLWRPSRSPATSPAPNMDLRLNEHPRWNTNCFWDRDPSSQVCDRVVHRHGAILPIERVGTGFNPRRIRHCGSWCAGQRTSRQWRASGGAREKGRRQNKETTNECSNMWHHGWHVDGVNAHAATPWAAMWVWSRSNMSRKSRVRCICLQDSIISPPVWPWMARMFNNLLREFWQYWNLVCCFLSKCNWSNLCQWIHGFHPSGTKVWASDLWISNELLHPFLCLDNFHAVPIYLQISRC